VTAYGKQLTTGCRSTTVRAGTGYSAPFCDLGILSRIDTILAYHEIPEGSAVRERHPHPSQQPLLPLVMVVSVLAGVISLRVDGKHSALLATFAFAVRLRLDPARQRRMAGIAARPDAVATTAGSR